MMKLFGEKKLKNPLFTKYLWATASESMEEWSSNLNVVRD